MMKKILLLAIVGAVTLMGHAQSLRNNLLKGYKPGDKLEKGVYTSDQDTPRFNTWYGRVQRESGGSGRRTCYR